MKLSIIGSGIVGQATGKYLLELGHQVVFMDVLPATIEKLKKENLSTTTSIYEAVKNSEAAFVCVPTPNNTNSEQDISIIQKVSADIGKALADKKEYFTVVIKSTVLPGTTKNIVLPELEKHSGKIAGGDFGLCMNPEFLTFVQTTWTNDKAMDKKPSNEVRIVIGEFNEESGKVLEEVYKNSSSPKFHTSLEEAEFAKYANNFLLPAKISAWNELFLLAEGLREKKIMDLNTEKIAKILSLDNRIGLYGSVHGKAYGGLCFSKDPQAFANWASRFIDSKMIKGTVETNKNMAEKYGIRQ